MASKEESTKKARTPGPKSRAGRRAREREMRRKRKLFLQVAAGAVVIVALAALIGPPGPAQVPLNTALNQHAHLDLFVNGTQIIVPPHIGINHTLWKDHSLDSFAFNSTEAAVHTHNTTGSIHVSLKKWHPCTLGDFFSIWGAAFDSGHLLSFEGPVTVSVNGKASSEFRGLVLQDGQNITIRAG